MSNTKKQHYVPRTYLKNFSFNKKKVDSHYLEVLSKKDQKIYVSNIEDVAEEKDFYTLENIEDKYMVENYFANEIEPILYDSLKDIRTRCENSLVQSGAKVINEEEKADLTGNILMQWLRGKQTREYERKIYDEYLEKVIDDSKNKFRITDSKLNKIANTFLKDKTVFKEIAISAVFSSDKLKMYHDVLISRNIIFYRIIGDGEFITSDNPVLLVHRITKDPTLFRNGILDKNTLIYYPISPKLIMGAYHPYLYPASLKKKDCQVTFITDLSAGNFIKSINLKQAEQCYNYVYANSKTVLEGIQKSLLQKK